MTAAVNWVPISPEIMILCWPFVDSANVNVYKKSVNKVCRERPNSQILKVTCNNAACRRNIFVERCKKVVNVELLLTERGNDEYQVTVTIFNPTLVNVVKINSSMSEEEIEEKLIDDLQKHDFSYNKKKLWHQL